MKRWTKMFVEKTEKWGLLYNALNTEKIRQKLTAYFFHFCVIYLGVFSVDYL